QELHQRGYTIQLGVNRDTQRQDDAEGRALQKLVSLSQLLIPVRLVLGCLDPHEEQTFQAIEPRKGVLVGLDQLAASKDVGGFLARPNKPRLKQRASISGPDDECS